MAVLFQRNVELARMTEAISEAAQWSHMAGGPGKPVLRNRFQPLPDVSKHPRTVVFAAQASGDSGGASELMTAPGSDGAGTNATTTTNRRIEQLEKHLDFLRTEHQTSLTSLQNEIERLKRENNELQFKLIMDQGDISAEPIETAPTTAAAASESRVNDAKLEKSRLVELNHEITEIKGCLEEQKKRHVALQHIFDQQTTDLDNLLLIDANAAVSVAPPTASEDNPPLEVDLGVVRIVTSPLRILPQDEQAAREPSLPECEAIIKLMLSTTMRLEHEMRRLQVTLDPTNHTASLTRLPPGLGPSRSIGIVKRPHPPPGKAKKNLAQRSPRLIQSAASSAPSDDGGGDLERAEAGLPPLQPGSLPPLRQHLGTHIAERRRKTQEMQKRRLANAKK